MNSHVSLLPASTPRSAFGKLLGAKAISAIARTQNAAQDIGHLLVWPTLFFAGLLFPRWALPAVLRDIGDWTPSGAAVHALQDSMLGTFLSAQLLLVLAGWAVVFGFLAVRCFRWE